MQPAHEGQADVFNGRDFRLQHGGDDGVAFGGAFGQVFLPDERESHSAPTQGGGRCPPEVDGRFRPLAPENQHPNHPSQGLFNQQRARAAGNAMHSVQRNMMQHQHGIQHGHDFEPGPRQQQQHRPMPQRQQLPMDAHPNFQGGDGASNMAQDRNVQHQQQHYGMQNAANHGNLHAQQQFSGADGEFVIPASHHSSASPSPSASSPSPFTPSSPGFHQESKLQQQHDEAREMLQVLAFPSYLVALFAWRLTSVHSDACGAVSATCSAVPPLQRNASSQGVVFFFLSPHSLEPPAAVAYAVHGLTPRPLASANACKQGTHISDFTSFGDVTSSPPHSMRCIPMECVSV